MKSAYKIFLLIIVTGIALGLTGCGSIGLDRVGKVSRIKSNARNSLTDPEMAIAANSYLVSHALIDLYNDNPEKVFNLINEQVKSSSQRNDLAMLIEISIHQARHTSDEERIKWLWRACRYSYRYFYDQKIQQPSAYNPSHAAVILRYYNFATGELFNLIKQDLLKGKTTATIKSDSYKYTCVFDTENMGFSPELFTSIDECLKYMPRGLISYSIRDAMGAPYIGILGKYKRSPLLLNPYFSPDSTIPLTVFVRFDMNNENSARFELFNTMITEETIVAGQKVPLSYDFSTPLAKLMEEPPKLGPLYLMFHPDKIADSRGLYIVSPYDPNKIPVVFVHGLMSNTRTWTQAINVLINDPRLRKKYQFWFFSYATGNQIVYSSEMLRKSLKEAQSIFDPANNNPNFQNMILIGHSMGGILSKTMVQNSGNYIVNEVLAEPIDKLRITPEQKEFLTEMLVFEHLPFIKRVVFIAVPHHGSSIALWSVSRWASSMITLPESFTHDVRAISKKVLIKAKLHNNDNPDYVATGVDNLSPDSMALKLLNNIPIDPSVKCHSIIGNEDADGVAGGTDGFVPYSSSHLDGISEVIVKSDHGVQATPKGIQEIKRIMLLHLKEAASNTAPKTTGDNK